MSNQQPSCPNCGTVIGCSCQWKTASDGKTVCSNCLTAYEIELRKIREQIADIKHVNDQPPV